MINPKKLYCFFREMIWDKRLSVKVTLIILLRLSLSYAQESGPIRIDEQDYCSVCLGDTVVYECTTVGQSAITHYTISGNPPCMLSLRNNRFDSGTADECQNREIIARANRIEGTNFISNVTITVDISPITVQCRSDTTMNRAKNLNVITSDGFPIQVEVDVVVNPEEQTCVFNWNSSCTADRYKPYTNCSDCTHDDSTVTCSNVRPGEICSISVRQVKCNRTSQESAQVTCVMQAMDLDSEESAPLATIIAPVVVVVVVVMTVVTLASILLIVVIIKKRHNKEALDISQNCGLANVSDHSDAGSVQMPIAQLSIELTERSENKSETDDKDNGRSVHDESTTQKSPRATYSQVDHGSADDHHRAMDEKESPPVQVSQSCVDQLRQEMNLMKEEVSQRFEDQLHEMRIGNEEMERKLNKLTTAIELKTQELDEKNLLLATKDSKISHLQKIIDQKDKELELKAREVSQKDRELNQRENLIDLQKKTIYELKIERDGLKEEVNSLYNELDHLKKQVGVMQNNMESRNEGERRDEAREKSIREALSKCEGILFETLAKALSVEKTPYKATMQHDSNSSAQPQTQPIVPETKVDKQHTELKFAQEVSHHQDIKNIAEYKNDQHSSHSTSEADTRLDQQVQYDHSISEDNNNSL